MLEFLPTILVVNQLLLAIISERWPSKKVMVILSSIMVLGCFYLISFVLQNPWLLNMKTILWLVVGAAQIFYVFFALFGGKELWKISIITQPLLFPFTVLAAYVPVSGAHTGVVVETFWLQGHIISATIAYGILTMAGLFAFAIVTRQAYLKARATSSFVEKLPSLEILERAQTAALWFGLISLFVAIIAGSVVTYDSTGSLFLLHWKSLLTLLTFILVVLLLIGKRVCGVRGRQGAQVVLMIYFLVIIMFLGSVFI